MPIYSPTGFLDITNATLRTSNTECQNLQIGSGNVYVTTDLTSNLVLNLENITNLGATTSNTVVFSNVTTGLTVSSNLVATGNVTAGTFLGNGSGLTNIPPSAITGTLSQWSDGTNSDVYIASNVGIGNVHTLTSNTLQVGANLYVRDADANVLTVTGNVAATRFVGDGSLLTGIASNLHQVVENGNVTSNTVQFTNATTGFITTSNVEIGGTLKINTISAAAYQSLQSVTDVSNSTSNTVRFTNATTGFTTTSNIDVGGRINMGGHMIPTADNTYDIGSAAFKIRDMYVSDNSLWIGDEAKISFTGNQIKFRRRKKSVVPSGLTTLGAVYGKDAATVQSEALASASGVSIVADMKLHHWMAYAKSLDTTKTTGDIFTDSADDYEASAASEAFKEVGDDIYSAHNVSIGKSTAPTTALDVNGTVTATAFVGAMPNLDATKITTGTLPVARGGTGTTTSTGTGSVVLSAAPAFTGDVTFDTDTLKIDSTNNRVGIGTTNPQYRLDVGHGGGATLADDVMLRVMSSSGTSGKLIFGRSGTTDIRSHAIESYNTSGSENNYMKFLVHDGTGTAPYETRTEVMTLLGNGNVGIGTAIPQTSLQIKDETDTTGTGDGFIAGLNGNSGNRKPTECLRLQGKYYAAGSGPLLRFTNFHTSGSNPSNDEYNLGGIAGFDYASQWGGGLCFYTAPNTGNGGDLTARMVIDSSGKVGIGTTSPSLHTHIKTNNTGSTDDGLLIENTYSSNTQKTVLRLGIGSANYAQIDARSKPGDKTYLTFSTQSGTGSWGDRMTIDEVGKITSSHKAGFVVGNPYSGDGDDYSASSLDEDWNAWVNIFNDAWIGGGSGWGTFWAGSPGALYRKDAADTNPNEYVFVGAGNKRFTFELNNGNAYFDGTLSQSNYDYAEYFEWEDGNPDNEDRRGYSVVLRTDGKIMKATSDDEPTNIIGIVSGTSSIVGDAAGYDWHGKYEVDEWGTKVTDEVYQLTWTEDDENHSYDEDRVPEGITVPENDVSRRLHNRERITPGYDDTVVYIPRDKRKEWCTVGLLGKVRLRDGCPTNPNWRYMKTIAGKELWLIR